MTEPSSQYGLSTSLPVASPATYLLLVDSRVSNYEDIINAKQPGVYHIVFDAATRPTHSAKLMKNIEDQIAALGVPAFTSIGLVQHNDGRPIYEMFGRISDRLKPVISDVATRDPDIQSWNRISLFITMLRLNYGIVNFDMMACALYSDPNWKHVIDKLTAITGVTVRASTDDTGAASLGGDWFLESHTGANLKEIYFTEAIENYTGVLYTAPSSQSASVPPAETTAKKLILIDNRIKDIDVIINAMNEDTYCLVFNYFYDTPASILSKLRFLTGNNRYILDNFHYEPPTLPTRMDASGNHCTPCDDFDTNDIQLVPGILENEYLEYTMSGGDASGNGGVWPFYSESTNITIQKPVFFQRAKIGETTESVPHGSVDGTVVAATETIVLNYKPRPMVLVSDLDAFYELGQNVGEIGSVPVAFDCVGIIQHTIDPTIGYKFVGGSDDTVAHAIVQDVGSRDSSLSSWAPFTAFIQAMKTAHQMTTLDLMACALYANPDWKFVIDTLAVRENITIRASLDNTGSGTDEDEANWVLETDNVSLTTVYFTDKIYEWKYVLATYIDSRFNALRWNDSMYATRGYDSRLKIAAGTSSFTIEAWYYETTTKSDATIVDMGDYNYTFQIRTGGGNWISLYNYSTGWINANIVITPGQWNHIAVTRSGSTFTFYLNGTARQVITNSASFYSNNSTFAIGWQSPDTCLCNRQKTDSVLYDIRLWNVARTANEILMNRNRIVPANSTGLVANYLCTDNGSTFNDRSVNALHTTIQNYNSARWSNNTVTIPNIGFLINNGYSLTTSSSSTALNAFTHFDNITYTDFSGVDLSGVNFRGADLTGCNFTNANLTNTNFANAYLINATTTNAITTGSNIARAITNLTSTVLNFDGINDGVNAGIPAWSNTTQFRQTLTVECWFKTADTNAQKNTAGFFSQWGTWNTVAPNVGWVERYKLHMLSDGKVDIWLQTANGWGRGLTSLSYNDTMWHHVAASYNSSDGAIRMYIDGVLVVSVTHTYPGILKDFGTWNAPIIMGSDYAGLYENQTDRQFRGQLSDVRIWNVVRSAAEIAANYQQRLSGNETGLVGYWKLNQGYGSGWATYSTALDSTSNRAHGTLTNMGATPSGSWVVSNINFQPRISAITLGPNNGTYNADVSFSFIDPSSNSLGNFTYSVSPTTVATVANGTVTTKTIYATSGAISIPTFSLYDFPEIASLSSWQIDVSFTVTGGAGTWRALVGDMYNNVSTGRGWGLWVSANNPSRIHWSWMGTIAEPATITVDLNTAYVLTAAQSSGTITLTLRTVSSGVIQTGSFSVGANVIGKGPVTIGGWQNYSGENFPGTISYVNVSVPTNQRVVTLASSTDGTPATLTATQASLLDYSNGSRTASLTVNKATPTFLTSFANMTKTFNHSFAFDVPLSNSTGAFSFTSSNTSVATINPAVTINALQFNGTTNFVDFAANIVELGKSSFTIECWVKTTGTRIGLLNCQDSDSTWESGEKSLYIDGNGIPAFVGYGCGWIYSTVAVNDNNWHHIAVTWSFAGGSSGTGTFYIDGINRTSTDYSIYNQHAANTFNLGTFVFGKPNYSESVNFFNGAVCELRIWNVARSAAEIYQNYRRMLVGNETGLVAYNRFNQGIASGTNTDITRVDNSDISGGYTGVLSGSFTLTGSLSNWVTGISIRPVYDVNVIAEGTTTITAIQASSPIHLSQSTTATLTVTKTAPTIGALTLPTDKRFGDVSFNLTAPTSNVRASNVITSTASVMVAPPDVNALIYGSAWTKLGGDIDGEAAGDQSGYNVAISADGTVVAIGAKNNDGSGNLLPDSGHVRVYRYTPSKTVAVTDQNDLSFGPIGWTRMGADIDGEGTIEYSGMGVSISADGTTVAIGAHGNDGTSSTVDNAQDKGSVRVYRYDPNKMNAQMDQTLANFGPRGWNRLGGDIDGETTADYFGISVSLSADGSVVAIGGVGNDGDSINAVPDAFYVRTGGSNWRTFIPLLTADTTTNRLGWNPDAQFYSVTTAPSNEIAMQFSYFAGYWLNANRATNGQSFSVPAFAGQGSVGTFVFTATSNYPVTTYTGRLTGYSTTTFTLTPQSDGISAGQFTTSGHVRVFRYTPGKGLITDQNDVSFGPVDWTRLGKDINGEATSDESGYSVSLSADGTVVAIGARYNDGSGNLLPDSGHVRVYRYTPSKTVAVPNQNDVSFGPVGWTRMGADIDGEGNIEYTGWSVALSADGTTVAIGAVGNDANSTSVNNNQDRGNVRVYRYDASKVNAQMDQTLANFGPRGWTRLGGDIDGDAFSDYLGWSVSLSADGTIVACGGSSNDAATGNSADNRGHVRIFKYNPNKLVAQTNEALAGFGPAGWDRIGDDIDGEAAGDESGVSVSLSSDGTTVAIGGYKNDGTSGNSADNRGHIRVYNIPTTNALTYSSSNSSVADVCGNLLLIKGVNGSSTITASQTTNTVTGILDVSGTTYTLTYNPTTYTSSNTSVATVSTYSGTVNVIGVGTTTITASQGATRSYTSRDVSGSLVIATAAPTIGALTIANVNFGVAPFTLTAPSTNSSGAFSYTSSNTEVATVTTGGTVTVVGVGSTTITATQAASGNYTTGSVSASFSVSAIAPTINAWTIPGKSFTDASFNLTAPTSNSTGAFSYTSSNTAVATVGFTTTSLLARYDTSKPSNYTLSGTTVTQWNDLTGNGYHLTQNGTGPTLTTINSITAFDFNSSKGFIRASVPLSSTITVFMVIKYSTNIGTWGSFMHHGHRDSDWAIERNSWPNALTSHNLQFQSNNVNGPPELSTSNNVNYILIGRINGSTREFWRYSDTEALGFTTGTTVSIVTGNKTVYVGKSDNNEACNSTIGEILYYNSTLSNTDVSANLNYLQNKWFNNRNNPSYVTIVGTGTTTITATQDASGNYTAGSVSTSLVVSASVPTFGTFTVPAKNFGDASFNLTAPTSNSTGAFSYTSSNTSVATVTSSGTVTVIGAGSTTITATQAAIGNYASGSVSASLVVSPIAPTIGALSMPAKNFGDASFNLTVPSTNSSGAFSYTSSNTSVATVTSGGTITVVGAGSTTITATQDASGNYTTGSVTASLVVSPIAPTIGALSMPAKNFGDASFNLTAPTSNSSGAFSYTSSNTSVATVTSGGIVTVIGAGSTTITATQAATTNYTTGSVTASLVVSPVAPTFGTFTIPEKFINDISFTLTSPSSNSNGAFTFSTDASGSAIATVTSGGIVTLTGVAGTATITATQAASANGNYTSRSVTATLIVNAALSNFTVPSNKVYADAAFDLTDPVTIYSGEPFIFTSSDTTVASIGGAGGRTVTIHKAGSTTITAKQVATGAHSELTITAVLVIAKKTTVITLSAITKNYGDASFNISPSSSNTDALTPTFTITSRNPDIISIFDASYAAIRGVGSVLIDITQSETTNFTTATATIMITVNKGNPVLSAFTVSTTRTYSSTPFSAVAYPTSVSNGTIVYSSSDSTVATIDSSGIITLLKAGYVNFIATQQATAYYNSTTKTTNTMTVIRQALALVRSSPTASIINKTYGDGYFNVIATNDSNGGTITYETNNPSVAGIVGNATGGVISVVSAGTATITARRGQTDQYTSDPVSWTVEVARTTTTLSGLSDLSYNVTAAPFTVTASSASNGAVTYSLQDPSSQVLTIHPTSGLVTLRSPGSAVIVASQAQGTNYFAPASITATITVSSAGNALQGATITSTASFAAVNLEGASLAGVSITNTAFTAAKLTNANLTNAVIVSANFASADLSGATLAGATITGATFTAASLKNADLSGAVLTNTAFTGSDLSGAKLTGVDASGASFANAKLNNVDLTGANIANVNFTNTSIKGAIIDDISFSPLQKIQLLKNSENRDIGQIIIPEVTGTTVLAAISETSPLRAIQNLDLATATVAVVVPTTSTSPTDVLPDVVLNVANSDKFYLPINESEFFQIEGVKYYATGGVVRNYLTNAVVEVISYNGTPVWLLAGSIVGLVLQTNTLNSSSFVIPSRKLITDTSPFMPTTLPTSNNTETPIVYSSSNPNIATINSSSGEITVTGNFTGFVHFTATQVQNATYEPGTSVSNTLFVDRAINFSLSGLNQTFNLSTLVTLDASSISVDATDATAIFYVRLSDINNLFMYQSDATDITNVNADDIKYYVFHRKWPTELKLNPTHAMMNKTESAGMLGIGNGYTNDKSLAKHDFIRYIALRLFNTIHAVDLFHNETELHENSVFLGETVRNNIDTILSGISTTSSSGTMAYDASGNKYLTNDASGNTNLCREIMRHIAAVAPSRFYGNVPNHAGLKNVPFIENDTLQYKLIVQAAASQNMLTGVSVIPSRSYTIKLVLKNTVNSNTNANSVISDSIMYPNSYPYSSSVMTYPPTSDSSGVYNLYSPPAPIPFARFGYNGWYYTNSTTWVNVAPAVRNHIKWLVGGNTATSKVGDLQYVRINLKIHNTASLPYVMIYTQAGSSRKYAVVSGNGSLTNGTVYSFYMNFNSYAREPAYIGYTNAALGYTIGTGSFANNETITSIALESDSNAAASNVEFTLSSIIVGELSTTTNLTSEKEYGFEAAVPDAYP